MRAEGPGGWESRERLWQVRGPEPGAAVGVGARGGARRLCIGDPGSPAGGTGVLVGWDGGGGWPRRLAGEALGDLPHLGESIWRISMRGTLSPLLYRDSVSK